MVLSVTVIISGAVLAGGGGTLLSRPKTGNKCYDFVINNDLKKKKSLLFGTRS